MEYILLAIGNPSKTAAPMVANILASYEQGGAFKHLDKGYSKSVHAEILVDAIAGLQEKGIDRSTILSMVSDRHFSIGNTSSWGQFLDENLQWQDEDGNLVTFKARFGGGDIPKPDLGLVV